MFPPPLGGLAVEDVAGGADEVGFETGAELDGVAEPGCVNMNYAMLGKNGTVPVMPNQVRTSASRTGMLWLTSSALYATY